MRDRTYIVDINTKMYEKPLYKQFDNDIPFRIKIIENGVNVNLSGYTIKAFFNNKSEVIQKNCIVNESVIETKLDNNILKNVGDVDVEFCLIKVDMIVTTFTITLKVEKSINRNEAVEKEPGWDIIKDFQTALDNAINKANEDINNIIKEANTNVQNTIDKAESDIENAINSIPPKSELIGPKGENGFTWRPSIDPSGNLTWNNNGSTAIPTSVNIKGPKGSTGATGLQGPPGKDGTQIITSNTQPSGQVLGRVWIQTY